MKKSLILPALLLLLPGIISAQPGAARPAQDNSSPALEEYFAPAARQAAKPDAEGFIGRWLLLDPINKANRSNTVFTDSYVRENLTHNYFEGQLSDRLPKDGATVRVKVDEEQTLQWHAFDSKLYNVKLFRFASGLQNQRYGVLFWAVTAVESPRDQQVRMMVGSNSASMWWLNGEEAVILSGDRRMVADDGASARLTLRKGRNIIWGSVINGPGMSDFCLRFVDLEGQPVTDLSITTK